MEHDEGGRLEALRCYQILDTEPEKGFDDLVLLAAHICQTPIALVSLVDADRQWFKARKGFEVTEIPRDNFFCTHAIRRPDLFVVADATQDDRFKNNPLVVSDPGIRFYAGAPLVARDGHTLGTLSVIDRKPRALSAEQVDALTALRDQAVAQLELRRNRIELQQARAESDASAERQRELVDDLQESFEQVKKLSGMMPLLSTCQFDMTFKAELAAIDSVAEGVMQILKVKNLVGGREFEVETALREALANAVEHGCDNDASKSIQCCVSCDADGELVIAVRDPGPGFDPGEIPDPRTDTGRAKSSGRGVFLINELMDDVRYAEGGREIQMRKKPAP